MKEEWKTIKLGTVIKLIKGISYKSSDYGDQDNGIIFITLKCISKNGGFSARGIKYFKGLVTDNQKIHYGDLLMANTDLTRDGDIIGCPLLLPKLNKNKEITMSMDLSKIEVNETVDRTFIYYVLMTDRVRRYMKDNSSGSTVLHLKTSSVPNLEITIPRQKPEQAKIAQILSTIDSAIEHIQKLLQKYQYIKTGLMQDLLTKGIDEQGRIRSEETHEFKDSSIGRIPKEWETCAIGDICDAIDPHPSHRTPKAVINGIPYIGINDIVNETIDYSSCRKVGHKILAEHQERYKVRQGDIIFGKIGTIGQPKVLPIGVSYTLSANVILLQPFETASYIFYTLNSTSIDYQVKSAIHSTSQPAFGMQKIRALKIPLPKKEEREQISNVINLIDKSIIAQEQKLKKLYSIKRGLMQDLLTGKKRVSHLL